tara:strand:- start:131 stop:346 length:216 start_codon:yes stop_codon:yes gene_type:complete
MITSMVQNNIDIGDMVENVTVQGTKGIVIQKDPSDLFFKVEWLVQDEEERGPLITTNTVMDLRLIARPARC